MCVSMRRARERESRRLHGIVCGPVVGSRLGRHHGRRLGVGVGVEQGMGMRLGRPGRGVGQLSLLSRLPHGVNCTVHKIAISDCSRYRFKGVAVDGTQVGE